MNRRLKFYLLASLISSVGTWIRFVITPLYVYQITNSFISAGISSILSNMVSLFFVPLISPYIAKVNKYKIVTLLSVVQCIMVSMYGMVGNMFHVYLITVVLSICSNLKRAANVTIMKDLVERDDYKIINTYLTTIANIMVFIGPLIGGYFASKFGYLICFYIDSISFALYGILMIVVSRLVDSEDVIEKKEYISLKKKYTDLVLSLQNNKIIQYYLFSNIALWIGVGGVLIIYPILCESLTNNLAEGYGLFWSIIGAGQLVGGLLIIPLKNRNTSSLYYYGILLSGVFHSIMFFSSSYIIVLILVGIATLGDGLSIVLDDCIVQENMSKENTFMFVTALDSVIALSSLVGSTLVVVMLKFVEFRILGSISSVFIILSAMIGLKLTKNPKTVMQKGKEVV